MAASSFARRFLTISFNVEIMAGRFWFVRSDVSIRMPRETASEGAASGRGRFGFRAGVAAVPLSGSRSVASKPESILLLPDDLVLAEDGLLAAAGGALPDAVVVVAGLASLG